MDREFEIGELPRRAIRDRDAIVAGAGQHARDGRANLARANDDDVLHQVLPGFGDQTNMTPPSVE